MYANIMGNHGILAVPDVWRNPAGGPKLVFDLREIVGIPQSTYCMLT